MVAVNMLNDVAPLAICWSTCATRHNHWSGWLALSQILNGTGPLAFPTACLSCTLVSRHSLVSFALPETVTGLPLWCLKTILLAIRTRSPFVLNNSHKLNIPSGLFPCHTPCISSLSVHRHLWSELRLLNMQDPQVFKSPSHRPTHEDAVPVAVSDSPLSQVCVCRCSTWAQPERRRVTI